MSKTLNVAIIDDDRMSSHNWNIQLKFIGETPLALTAENWLRAIENQEEGSEVFIVVVGSLMESQFNEQALNKLILAIHEWNDEMPILVTSPEIGFDELPESSRDLLLELPEESDYQFLLKTFKQARARRGMENTALKSTLISETGTAMFRSLVGDSEIMQKTRELMHQVADKMVNVLVLGESGTGKEIMARNLHYHSGRGDEPFIVVSCALVSDDLFGYEQGYQGVEEARPGLFEQANGGTIFFDEISDMPLPIQAKVMRFLERQCFERVGGNETLKSDVRVVAATNKKLEEKIADGSFREDLYYRLSVVPIVVPALREHVEDIPNLVNELIARLEHQSHNSVRLNSSAMVSLQRHAWPGNVRELANLIERLSIIQVNEVVGVSDLPSEYQHVTEIEIANIENPPKPLEEADESGSESTSDLSLEDEVELKLHTKIQTLQAMTEDNLKEYLKNFEKNFIEIALDDSAYLLNFAADRLSLSEDELTTKMKVHGL